MVRPVPQAAFDLATRPGFDCLHDPNPATSLIEPYYDPVGYPTQGYGELLSKVKWEPLSKYPAISVDEARARLGKHLLLASAAVDRLCPVPLSDPQRAALIDFAFNCGAGNLQVSALRQKVLHGEHNEVPEQLKRWVFAGGVKYRGLVRRRQAEAELYISGS